MRRRFIASLTIVLAFLILSVTFSFRFFDVIIVSESSYETELETETESEERIIIDDFNIDSCIADMTEAEYLDETEMTEETEATYTVYYDEYGNECCIYPCGVSANQSEINMLAYCVMSEAGSQSLTGKRLVVDVILNRCLDDDFPNNISDVISQRHQFSTYDSGVMYNVDPDDDCYRAIVLELQDISYPSVMYFRTSCYSDYGTPWKHVEDHYFSTK